jgi:hypothetical protein
MWSGGVRYYRNIGILQYQSNNNISQFITYLFLYPVDITHYTLNFNYYTEYSYATHNVKHITWRPAELLCWLWRHNQTSILRSLSYAPNEKQV